VPSNALQRMWQTTLASRIDCTIYVLFAVAKTVVVLIPMVAVGRGKVPALVRELIKDTRKMMSPFTALKLRERKTNNLKDYVSLSGTLGVSHMLCFSTTEAGTYLRLGKLPRGPTLYFKVENYTLCKDVAAAQRRPHSPGTEFLSAPIVVLNNMQVLVDPFKKGCSSFYSSCPVAMSASG